MSNRDSYHSATHSFLVNNTIAADEEVTGNVQFVRFLSPTHGGFWSPYSHLKWDEHMPALLDAMVLDAQAPAGFSAPFCFFERFSEAPLPHLVFDVDIKGVPHPDFSVEAMVAKLGELVQGAFARVVYSNTAVGYFQSMLWRATRAAKTSYHVHFFRLRMPFSEQVEVARYVYGKLEGDAHYQWLFNALDIEPNKRGHLRVPLSAKLSDSDDGTLDMSARLVFDSLRDVKGHTVVRADRIPWTGLADTDAQKLRIELCLHHRGLRPSLDLDISARGSTRSADRNSWRLKQVRVAKASSSSADSAPAVPPSRINMLDWSPATMCSSSWRQQLEQRIREDCEPYEATLRWFGVRAAVVAANNLVLKMVVPGQSAPELQWVNINGSTTAAFPKCSFASARGATRQESFLKVFMAAPSEWVDSFLCGVNFVPHLRSEPAPVLNSKLNTWSGWAMDEWDLSRIVHQVVDARWDNTKPLLRVLYYLFWDLCDGEPEAFQGMIYYLAHIVQRPHVKTERVLVVHGAEGTGKSTFFDDFFCTRILGKAHTVVLSRGEDVVGSFNSLIVGKVVILCEEALMNDSRANDQIKHLATASSMTINQKMRAQYQQDNHANLILLSNSSVPTYASKDARRLFVVRTTSRFSSMSDAARVEYWNDRAELLSAEETAQQFAAFLTQVDLTEQWDAWRISKRFLSVSLDQMRLESFDVSLQIVVGWLLARYTAVPSAEHTCMRKIGAGPILAPGADAPMDGIDPAGAHYECEDGTYITTNGEDPAMPGWARCVDEAPFLANALRAAGVASGKSRVASSLLALKREMTGLGFSFSVVNQLTVIHVPPYAALVQSFGRLVPGMNLDRIFSAHTVRTPTPLEDDESLLRLMDYFPKLLCEKEAELRSAHARALSFSQSQPEEMDLSPSSLVPPSPPRAARRRPRVLCDSDGETEFTLRPPPPPPVVSPASSPDPLSADSGPATPVLTPAASPPRLGSTLRRSSPAREGSQLLLRLGVSRALDAWEIAPPPPAKRVDSAQ